MYGSNRFVKKLLLSNRNTVCKQILLLTNKNAIKNNLLNIKSDDCNQIFKNESNFSTKYQYGVDMLLNK